MTEPETFVTHEDLRRLPEVRASTDRSFGLVFAAVFAVAGALPLLSGGRVRWWAMLLAVLFATVAGLRPSALRPLNRAWLWIGLKIGEAVGPVVLGAVFFGALTPIATLMRWRGHDPLRLRREPDHQSYWIRRTPPGPAPDTMAKQF